MLPSKLNTLTRNRLDIAAPHLQMRLKPILNQIFEGHWILRASVIVLIMNLILIITVIEIYNPTSLAFL